MEIIIETRNVEKTLSYAKEELYRYLQVMLAGEEGVFSVSLEVLDCPKAMDGFSVGMNAAGGRIIGNNPRSILLGVYDYLHHLGCRFLTPDKGTEVVPRIAKENLTASYSKTASFYHRGVCIEGANSAENVLDFIEWLPKVGYNSFFLQFKVPYVFLSRWYHHDKNPLKEAEDFSMEDAGKWLKRFQQEMAKRSLLLHQVGHGWTGEVLCGGTVGSWEAAQNQMPLEKAPMAALVNGKRDFFMGVPANTNLCFSNPDTVETFADQVMAYVQENPDVDYLHIWLADEFNNVCECEDCRKTTVSDQYVELLNELDRRLTEEKKNTRLVFLLYQELLWPPVREKLHNPDRFVLMFAPISRTFEKSYDLSNEDQQIPAYIRNQITLPTNLGENLAFLKGWQQQFAGESFAYDYPLGRAHYGDFGYLHISRIISQDIKQLHKMGLDGYISCQELRAASPNMLPNYVMGYTLFDESASVDDLIQEYYQAAYPEAPRMALNYLQQLSDLSSCDYLNGKGSRTDDDIAGRMTRIMEICRQQRVLLENAAESIHWEVLRHHNEYILRLSAAMAELASGQEPESYLEMQDFVCRTEPDFQQWLDVYRILEVTQKYTGFSVK